MSRFTGWPLIISLFISLTSCQDDNSVIPDDPAIFQDQYGRQLILHGLNTGSKDPFNDHWITESDVDREDREFGFNFVRFLILWEGIEPEKGVFDDAYLDRMERQVNWYTSRGMFVMLDMHQDLYARAFGGDGAPFWAIEANGHPIGWENPYGDLWFLKNLDPAVVAAFQNFWQYTNYKDLQDHYILTWQKVAERFRNNPYVIGYDLMNEPYAGDLGRNISGTFERVQLKQFYDRLIPALRAVDNEKYIIFEPTSLKVNQGLPSDLPRITDTRSRQRLAYAPHCYPLFVEAAPGPYNGPGQQEVRNWKNARTKELKLHNCPLIVGEIGISPDLPGFDEFLDDVFDYTDEVEGGWTYWFNSRGGWGPLNPDGTPSAILPQLVRTYPKAVQGRIDHFSFNRESKEFTLRFAPLPYITQPTEIFIPEIHYPSGYELNIEGSRDYRTEYDAERQLLKLYAGNDAPLIVTITAK